MKKYYVSLTFLYALSHLLTIVSCPCMPSSKNTEPFFEEYDEETKDTSENDGE